MHFSLTLLAAATSLLFAGVSQALPASGNSGLDVNTRQIGSELLNNFKRSDVQSSTFKSQLARRTADEDKCMICLEKIRAPNGLGSLCVNSAHETCRTCMLTQLRVASEEGRASLCGYCRGPLVNPLVFRVCKEATPPPSPAPERKKSTGSHSAKPPARKHK